MSMSFNELPDPVKVKLLARELKRLNMYAYYLESVLSMEKKKVNHLSSIIDNLKEEKSTLIRRIKSFEKREEDFSLVRKKRLFEKDLIRLSKKFIKNQGLLNEFNEYIENLLKNR